MERDQHRDGPVSLNRTLLVTHRGCLDGTGSALMYLWAGGSRDLVLFRNPSGLQLSGDDVPGPVEEVWYVDCCPQDLSDPAAGRPFWVFDHHVSSQRVHGRDPRCEFDMGECGTSLMANRLALRNLDDDTEAFIGGMRDYDLGRFENPVGRRLADLAATYTQEQFLDVLLEHEAGIINDPAMAARAAGAEAVRSVYAERAARAAVQSEIWLPEPTGRIVAAAAACPQDWKNDTANRILDTRPLVDVAVILDLMGGMVSLRSRPNGIDCSVIAGLYGGGGHAKAAGFRMPGGIDATLRGLIGGAFG